MRTRWRPMWWRRIGRVGGGGSGFGPSSGSGLLLEDGVSFLLLEDGVSFLLLEA